jgi:hypothetical protein
MLAGKDCHGDHTICEIVDYDLTACVMVMICVCQMDGVDYEMEMIFDEMEGCSPA